VNTLLHVALSNCVVALGLAVVAACVGRWCRRPAVAHGLWLLVLLKLVTPPLVFVPISWPERAAPAPEVAAAPVIPPAPVGAVAQPAPAGDDPPEQVPEEGEVPPVAADAPPMAAEPVPPQDPPAVVAVVPGAGVPWLLLAGTLWLAGSACWFAVALCRIRRFHTLLRHAAPAPAEVQEDASRLAARLGLARCPRVWLVEGVVSPMLWALGQEPRLLLPAGLLERVSDEQRATLLVHELAHLRRRDHVVRLLELLVLGLYWWFPLAWWARRELREAEEECCDAWVVWALPGSPRAYATALVETLDFLSEARPALPPAASGVGQLHLLRRRLTMIMRGTTPRALTGAGLLALLGLGLLLLPLVPSWAQDSTSGGGGVGPRRPPGGQGDLERARATVQKQAEELELLRARLREMHMQIEIRAKELAVAMDTLRMAELDRALAEPAAKKTATKKPVIDPRTGAGHGGLEHRLAEMERKLDQVLGELRELRREKARGGFPGVRPKDPNVPGGPGAPGGFPGVRPGGPGQPPNPPGIPGPGPNRPGFPPGPGGPNPGAVNVPAGGAPANPPPGQLQGRVLKVEEKLVRVSLGRDAGLKINHTLEVYRLHPEPQYLGRLRIEDVTQGEAVGLLLPSAAPVRPVQEGDQVASTLRP
jgi:beta-lactamase regulating signal transducer with metallopeptidase domain